MNPIIDMPTASQRRWQEYEHKVQTALESSIQSAWDIADLALHGTRFFDDGSDFDWTQAFDFRSISMNTLQNRIRLARDFPPKRRRWKTLSLSHYMGVLSLRDDNGKPLTEIQDNLLAMAERHEWSRDTLRDAVKQAKQEPVTESTTLELPIIEVNGRRYVEADIIPSEVTIVKVKYEIVVVPASETSEDIKVVAA